MNTVADKLMKLVQTKSDIRQALLDKGFNVPDTMPFSGYADLIRRFPCNAKDFPDIPGMIARWSAKGLTNEDMSTNPVWKDLTGNGYDLQMKNFGWAGMSGVNGYVENYNGGRWVRSTNRADMTWTSYSVNITSVKIASAQLYYQSYLEQPSFIVSSYTIRVQGLKDGQTLSYRHQVSGEQNIYRIIEDGIYTLPSFLFKANGDWYGFQFNKVQESCDITIEQLPLYPGFILGDGVDDFAVTEKELNFEDTYTVYTAFIPFQNNPTKNMMMAGKDIKDFYMNYSSLNALSYYSGNKSVVINLSNGFNLLCCKRDADNMTIKNLITGDSVTATANEFINNPGLYYLWRVANGYSYARLAIAGQTICNGYFSTDEDDEKVFDWYKKQYPWLFFDQAWTVTGKTNEDTDRDTIANITGNGNNLVLSNFGFIEGSGYNEEGEYAGYLVTDGVDDKIQSKRFLLHRNWTMVGDWRFMPPEKHTNSGIVKSPAIRLYNQLNNIALYINRTTNPKTIPSRSIKAVCSDGRIYLDDWSEFLDTELQTDFESDTTITIANYGVGFTKMVFKNLSFYDNQLLDKEDCIKAYNYLQTLKS